MFVLIYHLWETSVTVNLKGMWPTRCQFAIILVFRTLLNWGRESVVGRHVPGGGRGEERREV